jgi:putative ABC transport system permease protein
MRALQKKLFRDLFALRSQIASASLLMVSGVAILVASWSAFRSLSDAREETYRRYAYADIFASLKRAPQGLASKIARIPGVRTSETRIVMDGRLDVGFPATGRFVSIPSGAQPGLNQIYLRSGRLPIDRGVGEMEAVVHEAFAKANRIRIGDSIWATLEGRKERVRIVGIGLSPEYIASISPMVSLPDDLHFGIFWAPLKDLERIAKMGGVFNQVVLALDPKVGSPGAIRREEVMLRLDEVLKPYGGRNSQGRERQPSDRFLTDEIEEQKGMALLAPAFFLGIAAFLIHTITARLVTRHRPQIAALKAMGYTHFEVLRHYVGLTFLMMIGGVALGLLGGAAFGRFYAWSYSGFFRFPEIQFRMDSIAVVAGAIVGVLPGIAGGLTSVLTAYRLPAAEAMRPQKPPDFQAGLLERFRLDARLGPRGKMLWRSFFFRPWRSLFSTFGFACAVSVVVMTSSWSDIVDSTLVHQFERIQREDIGVYFLTPQPRSSVQAISRIPGVLYAEGQRWVPVRMRFLNHERELGLVGRPEQRFLTADWDTSGKTSPLPKQGVRVSRYFEKFWGMKTGDAVEFEVLEGRPRSLNLLISGFSDDLIGLQATLRHSALSHALDEEPGFNSVFLKTDPSEMHQIFAHLKELPAVATVQLKTALYEGFQATIGSVMTIMTRILTGFALVIAASIAYNAVRVTLSERVWETASLRVLGFSRGEVFLMLIGELAIQVGLAVMPGFIMGKEFSRAVIGTSNAETFGFQVIVRPETYARGAAVVLGAYLISTGWAWVWLRRLSLAESLKVRD